MSVTSTTTVSIDSRISDLWALQYCFYDLLKQLICFVKPSFCLQTDYHELKTIHKTNMYIVMLYSRLSERKGRCHVKPTRI